MQPQYRGDIDGLRSVAVLSVLIFHAFPQYLPGGFVGVDVFFVISGFLISGILLADLRAGAFSIRHFYDRRIRRIFPALIVVLVCCLATGWFLLLPKDYKSLGEHIAAGAGFISNLLLWSESGYFDKSAELKPLLHLWSLGIEEQFYIVWPMILWGVFRWRANLTAILVTLFVCSFCLNLLLAWRNPVADFYSPLSRFWELLAGGFLAHLASRNPHPAQGSPSPSMRHLMSLTGLLLIVIAVFRFDGGIRFPGAWALIPVTGACLLIYAGPGAILNRFLLASRPMIFIGLISYPLYLWHWPLLAFARIEHAGTPPASVRLGLLGLSLILAWLTYRFVEKPVRFSVRSFWSSQRLLVVMAIVALLGLSCARLNGIPSRLNDRVASFLTFEYDFRSDARVGTCWLNDKAPADGYAGDCVDSTPPGAPLVVLWGDSHAARLFPGLRIAAENKFRLAQFTRDSCPPVMDFAYENCIAGNRAVLRRIEALRPDTVILFSVWNRAAAPDQGRLVFANLTDTIRRLKAAGVPNVVVVGPAPQWTLPLPDSIALHFIKARSQSVPSRTYFNFDESVRNTDAAMSDKFGQVPGVGYFSALDAMCDAEGCLATLDGQAQGLTSWDYGHLTTPGATYLARRLLEATGHFGQTGR